VLTLCLNADHYFQLPFLHTTATIKLRVVKKEIKIGEKNFAFFLSLSSDDICLKRGSLRSLLFFSFLLFSSFFNLFVERFFPASAFVFKRLSALRFAVRLISLVSVKVAAFDFQVFHLLAKIICRFCRKRGLFGFDLTKKLFIATSWLALTNVEN
jgi:hypothetical protein